jgi:hypothetical protein
MKKVISFAIFEKQIFLKNDSPDFELDRSEM